MILVVIVMTDMYATSTDMLNAGDRDRTIAAITEQTDVYVWSESISQLFASSSPDGLIQCRNDPNESLAISAKWMPILAKSLAEYLGRGRLDEGDGDAWIGIDGPALSEFMGFVEGRLQVVAPEEWKECLRAGQFLGNGETTFNPLKRHPYEGQGLQPGLPAVPADAMFPFQYHRSLQLSHNESSLVVTTLSCEVRIDQSVFKGSHVLPQGVSALVDDRLQRVVIVAHGSGPVAELICVDCDQGGARPVPVWTKKISLSAAAQTGYGVLWFDCVSANGRYYFFYVQSESLGVIALDPSGNISSWFATNMLQFGELSHNTADSE